MEKRLTPAQIRALQEVREIKKHETLEERRAVAAGMERIDKEGEARRLIAGWYDKILAASLYDGVRFLVLAKVVNQGGPYKDLGHSIQADVRMHGFKTDIVQAEFHQAGVVNYDGTGVPSKGFKPDHVPQFGDLGIADYYLIVRW